MYGYELKAMTLEELQEFSAMIDEIIAEKDAEIERDRGQDVQRVEKLVERHREVLEHLARTGALTTGQVARLCFDGDEEVTHAVLSWMESNGWIKRRAF